MRPRPPRREELGSPRTTRAWGSVLDKLGGLPFAIVKLPARRVVAIGRPSSTSHKHHLLASCVQTTVLHNCTTTQQINSTPSPTCYSKQPQITPRWNRPSRGPVSLARCCTTTTRLAFPALLKPDQQHPHSQATPAETARPVFLSLPKGNQCGPRPSCIDGFSSSKLPWRTLPCLPPSPPRRRRQSSWRQPLPPVARPPPFRRHRKSWMTLHNRSSSRRSSPPQAKNRPSTRACDIWSVPFKRPGGKICYSPIKSKSWKPR